MCQSLFWNVAVAAGCALLVLTVGRVTVRMLDRRIAELREARKEYIAATEVPRG